MRTHLLRIVLDQAWRFSAEGNELYLGVGWFVTFWLLIMLLCWGWLVWRSVHWLEAALSVSFWLFIPVIAVTLYWLQPQWEPIEDGVPIFGYGFMMFIGFMLIRRIVDIEV